MENAPKAYFNQGQWIPTLHKIEFPNGEIHYLPGRLYKDKHGEWLDGTEQNRIADYKKAYIEKMNESHD